MLLLLDIQGISGLARAKRVRQILISTPGVLRVDVFADVGQAEVLSALESSQVPDEIVIRLRREGFLASASTVPNLDSDSDYARYYHAQPDSPEALWVD